MSDEEKKIDEKEESIQTQEPQDATEEKVEAPVENKEEEKVEDVKEAQEAPSTKDAPSADVEDKKDETIVIEDNTTPPPTAPIQELPRTAKIKEPMSKKKKITIIVVSIIAFIAVFSIVFFPLYFCYIQGRIHVYEASDFVAENGKRFVIEKDITIDGNLDLSASTCSIDLQGHSVTVNGTLTLGNDISIGTLKKGDYTAAGLISATTLVINDAEADINVNAALVVKDSLDITAKTVTLNNVSIVSSATFNNTTLVVKGPFTASDDSTIINLTNSTATFNGEIGAGTINATASNITLNSKVTAKNLVLDATSTLSCYGQVTSVTGGLKVAMYNGHACDTYTDVNILAIYDAFDKTYTASNCTTIVYLETLPTPVDFIVSEEGGVFKATCAKVDNYDAVQYKFIMDSKTYDLTYDNFVDITADLKAAGAASHKLQAYVIGNFDFATLETQTLTSGQMLYLDCETPATLTYSYTLKLTTPKNVLMQDYDSNVFISYDEVEFADYYVVTIDGDTQVILTALSKDDFTSNYGSIASQYGNNIVTYASALGRDVAALTSYLEDLGYHSLRIVACSFSKEIETSKEAMTSYKTTKQISLLQENVTATSTQNNDGTYTNTITISDCDEAKIFVLNVNGETIRISNTTTYTFTTSTSLVGETFTIQAEAYGYYTASAIQIITFA